MPNSSQGVGAKTGLNINAVSNGISGLKIACNGKDFVSVCSGM